MNIKNQLSQPLSRQNSINIIDYVGQDLQRFEELLSIFSGPDLRLSGLAAHTLSLFAESSPDLIIPHLPHLIESLFDRPAVAIKRNVLRIIQTLHIPRDFEGKLYELCLEYLHSANEPIAIRAFSMTILRKIAVNYPDLTKEVMLCIQDVMAHDQSPGIQARGKKELKILSKTLV